MFKEGLILPRSVANNGGFTTVKYKQSLSFSRAKNFIGFTLIELLIVIAIIAIIAAAIIIGISPGDQLTKARDATRENHIKALETALYGHYIFEGDFPSAAKEYDVLTEICNTNKGGVDCTGLVDLSDTDIPIPVDPQGGYVSEHGTGYQVVVSGNKAGVHAPKRGTCGYSMTDSDANTYNTVEIGSQCWMAENLAYLPAVNLEDDGSTTIPKYYVYGYSGTNIEVAKSQSNYTTYGVLYNQPAAQISCPDGWHLPSDTEQHTLENYLATGTCDAERSTWDCSPVGTILKANSALWSTNTGTDNYGFFALPGGNRRSSADWFVHESTYAHFWSSTSGYTRLLHHTTSTVYRTSLSQANGFSVRCLRD